MDNSLEGAEVVGFGHGQRWKIVSAKSFMYTYKTKDGKVKKDDKTGEPVKAQPGLLLVPFNNNLKKKLNEQFYSNGGRERVVASVDGKAFKPAAGSSIKNVWVQDSNAHRFMVSLREAVGEDAKAKAWFTSVLSDFTKLTGLVFDVVAQPTGKGQDGKQKTLPVVGTIIALPNGHKPNVSADGGDGGDSVEPEAGAEGEADAVTPEGEDGEAAEAAPEGDDVVGAPEGEDEETPPEAEAEPEEDPTVEQAQGKIVDVLEMSKYAKGIKHADLVKLVAQAVKGDKNKNKILAHVQSKKFLTDGPWEFDPKTTVLTQV